MVCLDQQCSGKEEAAAATADLTISDLDDFSTPDCTCCLKGHNSIAVGSSSAEEVYYRCLQCRLQAAH